MRSGAAILAVFSVALAAVAPRGGSSVEPQAPPPSHKYGLRQPLPRASGAIRMATYNVLNLFDHVDDPSLQGEFDDIRMATAAERCEQLAAVIRRVDPDIIALQEVESLEALEWFRDTFLPDAGYEHLASRDVGYYRGVECSLMSRYPVTAVRTWPDVSIDGLAREGVGWAPRPEGLTELEFQRSPLMATVRVRPDYEITLIVVHHKSGGKNFSYHRESEALKTTELIAAALRENPSRNLVVLGDFNAAPWDKSVRVYLAAGMIDSLAHRLALGEDESLQYKTHESGRVLDYVLLNSAAHRELVIGSPHVVGTHFPPPEYDWRTDLHPPGYASDHYPVVLDLMPKDRL